MRACSSAHLPSDVVAYKRTPVFTDYTVPAALLRDHSTKEGCWALIHVLEGTLLYVIEDSRRPRSATTLHAGEPPGLIEPTIMHRVEPSAAVRFQVEFYRSPAPDQRREVEA
jgi:tellurite resistance-related uncharacterized protein